MKHKYPFLECRYEKNEEGKYYLVTSDLSNIIKSIPSRYLLPHGNPGFNHENLTHEIEILRNLDSYLQRSDFHAIKRIYDLTDNFNSLEDGPEKYEIGNKLVNDLEHEFKVFYSKHTGASPVREYFANGFEAYFYHMQLGLNGDLSWAPLQPLGSWYNPVLFKISENPITFQSQSSWVIMTPIIYCLSIYFYKKEK